MGINRETVRSATTMPSFDNSPWIRGAPHRGLAVAIRTTSAAIWTLTGRRPTGWGRESLVQCARKRRRRHRTTVSGATITSVFLQPVHTPDRTTQNRRSVRRSFGRYAARLYTASCWRKTTFSRAN